MTKPDLTIRIAEPEDAEGLASIAERTFRETFAEDNDAGDMESYLTESFSAAKVADELSDSINTFLLAISGDPKQILGYAKLRKGELESCVKGPDPIELQRLYVDKDAIGLGVGSALMRACFEAAFAKGFQTLWLGVWERNLRAIAFYERWEFETVGRHDFRLGSDIQTDLIMERTVSKLS